MPVPLSQDLLGGRLCLHLLPRAAYSARDPLTAQTLGVSLERQCGVHSIDSDRRVDFDTLPGVLAYTPAGVEVFSESAIGGEYLLVRWSEAFSAASGFSSARRVQCHGHGRALALGRAARRLLLDPHTERMALEECALAFAGLPIIAKAERVLPKVFGRGVQQITEQFDQPLSLEQLAVTSGQTELRFLRDFTRAIGLTPHAYLVEVRVQAARRLIEQTTLPLAAIAQDTGFAHQSHMGSAFRKLLGMTPSQYRARF